LRVSANFIIPNKILWQRNLRKSTCIDSHENDKGEKRKEMKKKDKEKKMKRQ